MLVILYGPLLWFEAQGQADLWAVYSPHGIGVYVHLCKAAMMIAVLAHFWWLGEIMRVVHGAVPCSLGRRQRDLADSECRRTALRLAFGVRGAASLWMLAHGLALSVTYWSYLFSLGLAVLFTAQFVILQRWRLVPFARRIETVNAVLATVQAAFSQVTKRYEPAEVVAVLAVVASPAILNQAGALVATFLIK